MATVTVTNLTDAQVPLSDFYTTLESGAAVSTTRAYGEITAMFQTQALVAAGTVSINIVFEPDELVSEMTDPPPHADEHAATGKDPMDGTSLGSGAAPAGFILETDGLGGFNLIVTPTSGGGGVDILSCDASIAPGDVVYISASNTVAKASAESGVGQTSDAIAIVDSKPTSITCVLRGTGLSPAVFVGLSVGATYYLSATTPGGITSTAPTAPGTKVQEVGTGASSTRLYVDIDATSFIN
jgi:hypothetical protein